MTDDYIGVTAIVGEEGSGKSSMALTFPKPIFHFEVDFGGFDRAVWFIKKGNPELKVKHFAIDEDISATNLAEYDILSKPYPKPMQVNKLMGQLTGGTSSIRTIQQPKKVEGMKELWQTIITDFVHICGTGVNTMTFDSGTALWNIAHNARLQELQEVQEYKWRQDSRTAKMPFPENEYRERLQPIEYGQPNDRMTTLISTGRSTRKNIILTHYPTDEYGMVADGHGGLVEGKTGKQVIDGFKHTAKLCDLILWLRLKDKKPVATITKCGIEGMGMDAVGTEITATFNGVVSLRNLMQAKGGV